MVKKEESQFLQGQLLLAMPMLDDPNFHQTVVCLCEYSATGSMGVIVNRLYPSLSAENIFKELEINCSPEAKSIPLYNGGPVNMGDIFVLHGAPFNWAGCLMINPSLALSNTIDILKAIAAGQGPSSFLIILGCSGWSGGQLDLEIKENFWLNSPADERIIFETSVGTRWAEGMKLLNIDPALISRTAGNA